MSDKYSFGHVSDRFDIENFGQSSFKYVPIIVGFIALSLKDFIIQIKSNRKKENGKFDNFLNPLHKLNIRICS